MAIHDQLTGFALLWLLLFLLSPSDAQESCTAVLKICVHLQVQAGCNVTLQEGLQEVSSWDPVSPPHDCVLNLSPGEHVLSSPVAINGSAIRFRLRGSEDASTSIKCDENITYTENHSFLLTDFEAISFERISFHGCARPIRINNSRSVSISKSLFRVFSTGALDVYNCLDVRIVHTTFNNNTATAQIQDAPFRGNAGGVAIGSYRNPFYPLDPSVTVINCTFTRNRAEPAPTDVIIASDLIEGSVLTGRGGGMAIYIGEESNVDAIVEDCRFEQNYARSFGGGLYFILRPASNQTIEVKRSEFYNNEAGNGGGGLIVGYPATVDTIPSLNVSDCIFVGNKANFGGGSYISPLNGNRIGVSVEFINCTFEMNQARRFGSAVGLLSLDLFISFSPLSPYVVEDCKFYNNTGRGAGALDVTYSPVVMKGYNDFVGNIGPAVRVIGAEMTIEGTMNFLNNNAENFDGGALYITSYGQIVMNNGSAINFVGNKGRLGSAIVLESRNVVNSLTRTEFNPLCFIRYGADPLAPPREWTNVSINFSCNAAVIGPAAYMNQLDLCAWDLNQQKSTYDRTNVLRWPFVHYGDDNQNLGHPSALINDSSLFIQTPPIKLNAANRNITVPPGFPVQIAFEMSDELNNPTSALIRINGHQIGVASNPTTLYTVEPNLVTFQPESDYQVVKYAVSSTNYVEHFNVVLSTFSTFSVHQEPITQNVDITAQSCPPGYYLVQDTNTEQYTCICNTANKPKLVHCEPDGETLVLVPNTWTAILEYPNGSRSPIDYHCPPDYCGEIHNTSLGERTYGSLFTFTQPDVQCSCNRSGVLCGSCPEGFGVSALSNRCVTCSSVYALLLVALVVVGILISIGIVLYPRPLPVWVYPCLFYVQILPYIAEDFPITFSAVQKLLYYVSSGLALYFPYDFCLYGALNPLVSYLLRYLPLFTVVPTVIATLAVKHKKLQSTPWYGVWTLLVLMYSHVVHTSIVILNCRNIVQQGRRWYINGDIECFKGGHLPLALLAITVLLATLLLIPLTIVITLQKLPQKFRWLKYLLSPLTEPFRENFKWWSAIELLRRFLLLLFIVPFLGSRVVSAFIIMIITTVYLFVQPYRSLLANILEAVQSVTTLILLFIVSDTAIVESLLLITDLKQLEISITKDENCPDPVRGVTRLSILLASLYYLPLVILIIAVIVIVVMVIFSLCKNVKKFCQEGWEFNEDDYNMYGMSEETRFSPQFKQTSVHISSSHSSKTSTSLSSRRFRFLV